MKTPPPIVKGKVVRPAMIELGLADPDQLDKTMAFYKTLLGEASYPFRLAADMALLCRTTDDGSTDTVIYWQVPGSGMADLEKVYDDLIRNHGCQGVRPPHKMPASQADSQQNDTALCTLADPSGGVVGLVINPPYPFAPMLTRGFAQAETINPPFPRIDAGQPEAMA
ncbi:VOC family protein [Hymenobacter convexus]|uniref:VOC family protein n=1 Tax=Hymenobacter sp. CA1UV-4 TaxID=3063782 RepID=UPI002712CD09|nr:hypothetical protein [Hymenobacter sp. CA1UV-4]MDO7850727.1 hypothetical protein [Hymenobacter sp. CA1UV-4]